MVTDDRKFDRTKLTNTVIGALADSIVHMTRLGANSPTHTLHAELNEAAKLLERLTSEPLDVRLVARDY